MARRALWAALALLSLVACQGERGPVELPSPEGPPTFQTDVALQHAAQFEEDELGERPAGSQQEQGAAVYILGVLQRNGYVVRLDAVPVRNLVTSTNVIAASPEQDSPDVAVVVSYDTPPNEPGRGEVLGAFLELSRALNVTAAGHNVWFVALGAEQVEGSGGELGSRRFAEFLVDQDEDPFIIRLVDVEAGGAFRAGGSGAERLRAFASSNGEGEAPVPPDVVFTEAGFETVMVAGGIDQVGRTLLRFLAGVED